MRRLIRAGLVGTFCLAALVLGRGAGAAEPGYNFRPVVSGFGNLTYNPTAPTRTCAASSTSST